MRFKVFVVSLEERQDRRLAIKKQLDELGWEYEIWNADWNENGVKGLILTMLRLLMYCEKHFEGQSILVLEDDAKILPAIENIDEAIKQLPQDFEILKMGCNLCQRPAQLYSPNLIHVNNAYATHADLYSPAAIRKTLSAIEKMLQSNIIQPLDVMIVNEVQKDGNCYCTFPMMITQISGYSSIEKKEVDYTVLLEKRFEQQTKHLI